LRKQQTPIKGLPPLQTASDDSKRAVITTLKERIRKLEAENRGLRDQIEFSYGRTLYADEQAEKFKREVEALRAENADLKKQLEECRTF
jgi:chromosome segregation ATPase